MKWTLSCATAFAVTAVATALTLPGATYTPAVQAAPLHAAPVAADAYAPVRPHPVRVAQPQRVWVVRSGDTLSAIAQLRYGTQAAWTLIYWTNHKHIKWANRIQVGQKFWLPDNNGRLPAAPKLLEPPPPPPPRATVVTSSGGSGGSYHPTYRHHSYSASGTYNGSGSMQRCIISRESGGNSQVMNSSGHYGLYQFSASTWAASGGNPAHFGNASVAEQNQAFYNAVAARGYSDWTPYDGC